MNAKPILVEWYYGINFGSVCDPPFIILNRLRNRESEKAADVFLEKLKGGKLEILSEVVSDFERLEDIKNKESTIKIKSWFAGDRKEDKTKRLSHTGLKGIMETVANLCQRVLR